MTKNTLKKLCILKTMFGYKDWEYDSDIHCYCRCWAN